MPDAQTGDRARILSSIRIALDTASTPEAIAAEYASLPRRYTASNSLDQASMIELFADRLHEYDAGVYYAEPASVAAKIGEILGGRGKKSMAIAGGTPLEWLAEGIGFDIADDHDAYQLDRMEGILSGCTVAIAETGSIVLQNAAAQGPRKLSLVPDYHLCIVRADQVVATVPEAFARLDATSALPTTFISGPSATADIEMTRIKGVHGPRFLDVLIVSG